MTASARGPRAVRVLSAAWSELKSCWLVMAQTALLFTALATVVLLPLIGMLFQFLITRTHSSAVADIDIARFFFTSWPGAVALVLVSALFAAVTALELACLMGAGLGRARGVELRVRDAFALASARAAPVLGLTLVLVLRVLALVMPFAVLAAASYWGFLRRYDINYYLSYRPAAFWLAAALMGISSVGCALILARKAIHWVLILPLVVFEGSSPTSAFSESTHRMRGHGPAALGSLGCWAVMAIVLPMAMTPTLQVLGRLVAPAFGESMVGLLSFVGVIAVTWLMAGFAMSVVLNGLFALLCVHWYVATAPADDIAIPPRLRRQVVLGERRVRVRWSIAVAAIALAVPVAAGVAYLMLQNVWADRSVRVFAHRGASDEAPENTLAAFRQAGTVHADFVELDVQESADGVVLVAHDSDLMKVARVPLKIWSSTAAQLRSVDIGSHYSSRFADQRVPTLAEALSVCKGVTRVDIELKDYGHNQRLEERVIELVEAAGMQDQIVTMSLSRAMVARIKMLRPKWTSGLLIAKAVGNVSRLPVDFLAVESRMATRDLVRSAHATGKPVYVWTVNDTQRMIRLMGLGVDGLITDRPGLGKEVVADYAAMNQAQRLFLFVMTRLGMKEEISEPEGDLRP